MFGHRSVRVIATLGIGLTLALGACGDDDNGGAIDVPAGNETTQSSAGAADNFTTIEDGKLTVCSDIPYAPFEFEDGGELKGIDIDLMRAIAEDLGLSAEFRDTDFDGIFAALSAGNCDVIASSVSITEERKQSNDFSAGYFEINQSLLVRKADEAKYTSLESLKGRTIGVQSETTGEAFAQERAAAAGFQVRGFTGADELFTALKAQQVDAVLQDLPVNAYNAATTGESVVAQVFSADEAEEYGFVIPKTNPGLKTAIDAALEELRSSGRYDEILEEYLGTVEQPE